MISVLFVDSKCFRQPASVVFIIASTICKWRGTSSLQLPFDSFIEKINNFETHQFGDDDDNDNDNEHFTSIWTFRNVFSTMHHPNDSSTSTSHGSNNEWYWNLNLHRDRLSLANTAAIDGTILPSSSAFYTSAVLTDVGICVGMRNVNLNSENQHCFYPRKIPNCFNNLNVVGEQNKQTWDQACQQMAFPPFGAVPNVASAAGPMYTHHSSVLPAMPPPSSATLTTASVAYNLKMHNYNTLATSLFDNRLSHANCDNRFFSWPSQRTFAYPTIIEDPSPPLITLRETFHPYNVNRLIKCDLNELKMNAILFDASIAGATAITAATPSIPSSPDPFKVLSPLSANESHRRCHVAAPKKKWIRNYMLSKFAFVVSM